MRHTKKISIFMALVLVLGLLQGIILNSGNAQAAQGKKMVILYTANLRGDTSKLAKIAAVKKSYEEKENTTVKLVDLGNYLQGTKYTAYDLGAGFIGLMKETGYDVLGIGRYDVQFGDGKTGSVNHGDEREFGSLGKHTKDNGIVLMSSNVVAPEESDPYFDGYTANTVFADGEFQVGIFGLSSEEVVNASALSGVTVKSPEVAAGEQTKALSGNDVVIGLSNAGVSSAEGATICDVKASQNFTAGVIEIDETAKAVKQEKILLESLAEDTAVAGRVKTFCDKVDGVYPTAVVSEVTLNGNQKDVRSKETNLSDFWCDALRWYAVSGEINSSFAEDAVQAGNDSIKVDADHVVAVWNGGNLRNYLNVGSVINTDIYRILPYPNKVSVAYLTGAQLRELLESSSQNILTEESEDAGFLSVAGLKFTIDAYKDYDKGEEYGSSWYCAKSINRVSIQEVNGKPFNDTDVYAVITSNANYNGMDSCYVMKDKKENSTITTKAVRDAVFLYIEKGLGGTIGSQYADTDNRITINYTEPKAEVKEEETKPAADDSNKNTTGSASDNKSTTTEKTDDTTNVQDTTGKAPGRVTIKSVKSKAKKKATLKWKKVKNANGYVIYQVKKSGKKTTYKKVATVKKGSNTSYTIKKLKSKKTYKFVMKAYVKSGKTKVYSKKYSKIKKVKVK